jgi:hypothetical protein
MVDFDRLPGAIEGIRGVEAHREARSFVCLTDLLKWNTHAVHSSRALHLPAASMSC